MNKQDYIEEIANCIADSWLAADAGDQVARKAAIWVPWKSPSRPPRTSVTRPAIGSPSPNSEQPTCIRPQFGSDAAD